MDNAERLQDFYGAIRLLWPHISLTDAEMAASMLVTIEQLAGLVADGPLTIPRLMLGPSVRWLAPEGTPLLGLPVIYGDRTAVVLEVPSRTE